MSKLATVPPQTPRTFIAGLDPVHLVEILDEYYERGPARGTAPYQTQYEELRTYFLEDFGQDCTDLARLFSHLDNFAIVEEAFRRAGFVVGFNVARQLLLGELDLTALTKDEERSEDDTSEGGAQ